MKKGILIAIISFITIVVVGAIFYSYFGKPSTEVSKELENSESIEGQKNVFIENFVYSPQELTISKGETVVWTNKDLMQHNVASDEGNELASELLGQGETYSHNFDQTGEYSYHCTPHPFMKGKIIVQ